MQRLFLCPLLLLLYVSCTDDDISPIDIELSNLISNCNRERETFELVENLNAVISSSDINQGPFYFRVTTGFDAIDIIYMCTMEDKFKVRDRRVLITGALQLLSKKEEALLGLFPSDTRLFVLEPSNIEFTD